MDADLQLQLKLLGGYELLTANGTAVRLPTRKSWALLVILAQSSKQESTREELTTLLWPHSGEEQARASLRQELAVLRKTLQKNGLEPVIAQGEVIRFDPAGMVIDTYRLREFAKSAEEVDLHTVTDLYTGEFVAGLGIRSEPFEEWVWVERQNLRNLALDCLLRALDRAEKHQNPERAGCIARAILDIDLTDETAHRALMRGYWETGRKAEALKQFKRCREILARDLDTEPSSETCDLADRIRVVRRKPLRKMPLSTPAGVAPRTYQASIMPAISPPEKREVTFLVFGTPRIEALSRKLDPEELSLRLERSFNLCLQVVTELGGMLANHFGDRMVFTFGYPDTSEHDAKRAVLAAQKAFAGQQASEGQQAGLRCGIAQGETLVTLQSGIFQNLPYFSGAAVFRACALEQMAQASQILVAGNLRKPLESSFELALLSDAQGGSGAYAVKAERRTSSRFEIQRFTELLSGLTGRHQELAELIEVWQPARAGSGRVAVLQGEPGIGKSRLLYSFQQEVLPDAPTVLQISGSPHHRQSALFPVIQCL
jgi:DNA-binding SARP family transcriptional activator